MKPHARSFVFSLAILACSGESAPQESTRGPGGGRGPQPIAPVAQVEAAEAPRATTRSSRSRPPPSRPAERPRLTGGPETPSAGSTPSAADLSAALARAFGTPTGCISPATRERLRDRLTMQVQVNVTPTGVVTRANVSSSQLAAEDLECMREHAERLRLGPIPDAPRAITTSVEYTVASGRVEAVAEQAPAARAPGSVAPGYALPAGGTATERPPGFVPPSQTLPARVD